MSVAERLRVTVGELVYEAPLLMLTEPLGSVVSEVVGGGVGVGVTAVVLVVKVASLPYDVPTLLLAAMRQ